MFWVYNSVQFLFLISAVNIGSINFVYRLLLKRITRHLQTQRQSIIFDFSPLIKQFHQEYNLFQRIITKTNDKSTIIRMTFLKETRWTLT